MAIYIAKTYLPPLNEYLSYLKKIWKSQQVTNCGELEVLLEKRLKKFLGVKHLFMVANGTLALQLAIRALGFKGEVITTPFSYIATSSSLIWENCKPVFVDIEPETLCLDPANIERAITKNTTGIVATHVYGNPCEVLKIEKIAKAHNLKVIFDAAHAFGVKYLGKAIGNYGDISIFSFHATKVFHTIQGGAIATNSKDLYKVAEYKRRFGHKTPTSFWDVGINARSSELHAAVGLCLLSRVNKFIKERKMISKQYDKYFEGAEIEKPVIRKGTKYNFSYYPLIFKSERQLLNIRKALNREEIFPRRYFYPSLDAIDFLNAKKRKMEISRDIARRIMCLPIYYQLSLKDVEKISKIVLKGLKS